MQTVAIREILSDDDLSAYTVEDDGRVWRYWCSTGTTSTINTAYYDDAWNNWTTSTGTPIYSTHTARVYRPPERRYDNNEHVLEWKSHVRLKARKQSLRLLYEMLNPTQWFQLKNFGFFDVIGGKSKDIYRIHWKRGDSMVANVEVLKDKTKYAANDNWKKEDLKSLLCAHPEWKFTIGDQLLTQKLLIEYEEENFLKIANKHPVNTKPDRIPRKLRKAA